MEIYPSTIISPIVTICIPTYNHELYIEEAIESVLSQMSKGIQIILSDDASVDNTVQILKSYKNKYPDIIDLLIHKENIDIPENINAIRPLIRGKYICWFAGDDSFLPLKLQKQIAFMDSHPQYVMSYHNVLIKDRNSIIKYDQHHSIWGHQFYSGKIADKLLMNRCFIAPTSVMIRACGTEDIHHQAHLGYCNDWIYFIELAIRGEVGYIHEILSIYYRHQNNASKKMQAISNLEKGFFYIKNKYGSQYYSSIDYGLAKLYFDFIFRSLLNFNFSEAKIATILFVKSASQNPLFFFHSPLWFVTSFFKRIFLRFKIGRFCR